MDFPHPFILQINCPVFDIFPIQALIKFVCLPDWLALFYHVSIFMREKQLCFNNLYKPGCLQIWSLWKDVEIFLGFEPN